MLESIADAANLLVVNDNSSGESPHEAVLAASRFGMEGRLIVDRTPFDGFGAARNVCLRLHAQRAAGDWVMFVDADEVLGPQVGTIAARLPLVPPGYDFVDGYTWHFFASFDYYTSIERRMMFFRYRAGLKWEGAVHERLTGLSGKRLALPYLYGHYGHTLEPRRHAEKGRHYSSLGAPGEVLPEDRLGDFDVSGYFRPVYPRLLRFAGKHPPEAQKMLELLAPRLRREHELTQKNVNLQGVSVKVSNVLRRCYYEVRWRSRFMEPLSRRLMPS
jgi:glycosyltransferase involved in cell wall biosynthesis